MLATHALSFCSPAPPSSRPYSSRPALADSTNVDLRSNACGHGSKRLAYPTSTRIGCGWDDIESSITSISTSLHSRPHHLSSAHSPFPVTYKAPPTVSISLSAACSQSVPGDQCCGSGVQGSDPDLPDVTSVVPFPSTLLDSDMDVEMFDGTRTSSPDGHLPSTGPPRKRRSAHFTSASSPQGGLGKDAKQKRPRKSKRHVAELWWLGVIHRSILRGIEVRHSAEGPPDSSPGPRDFDAMDRTLIERIQKRLAENGCADGRMPSLLPRISSSISAPSLPLLALSMKRLPLDPSPHTLSSESHPKEDRALGGIAAVLPASKAPPRASLSIVSYSPTPSSTPAPRRRHVRFEIIQRPRQPQSHPNLPRRSPSPPARARMVPTDAPTLTLTMPQLVASLTLAYRERNRLRLRGRTCRPAEYGKNPGRPLPSAPCQVVRCGGGATSQSSALRARLSCAPERKSPLSSIAYTEGCGTI